MAHLLGRGWCNGRARLRGQQAGRGSEPSPSPQRPKCAGMTALYVCLMLRWCCTCRAWCWQSPACAPLLHAGVAYRNSAYASVLACTCMYQNYITDIASAGSGQACRASCAAGAYPLATRSCGPHQPHSRTCGRARPGKYLTLVAFDPQVQVSGAAGRRRARRMLIPPACGIGRHGT